MMRIAVDLLIMMWMYEKNSADKKKFKQKKKLKIGMKLQKNLDKNKFGLDKKKSYCSAKKVYWLAIKKCCLSIKKRWSGEEKTDLVTTPSPTYTTAFHIHNTT